MPLGAFGLLSIFYIFLGVRFLLQFFPRRKAIFDDNFTSYDRSMLGQAAFFILLPISVLLHELGHAIAIWSMGGQVLGYGFYFFSGYVSYDPSDFSAVQQTIVAFAGTFVNLLLIVLALAVVFLKRPPLRAPWNELLLQFVFISGINALIFYPAMDFLTGMSGDWTQMYQSGVPWLTAIIVAIQIAFIAAGWWGLHNPHIRDLIAERTGLPKGSQMRLMFGGGDGGQGASKPAPLDPAALSGNDQVIAQAMTRVAAGWSPKPSLRLDHGQGSTVGSLIWQSSSVIRTVAVLVRPSGEAAIVGTAQSQLDPSTPANQRMLQNWPSLPGEDELTIAVRIAAEQVETWPATRTPLPAQGVS